MKCRVSHCCTFDSAVFVDMGFVLGLGVEFWWRNVFVGVKRMGVEALFVLLVSLIVIALVGIKSMHIPL